MCEGRKITHEDLRLTGSDLTSFLPTLDEARINAERETIIHALNAARRNVSEAAPYAGSFPHYPLPADAQARSGRGRIRAK